MFVFKIHKIIYSFFFFILFFVNIMKQNLYAFLQTWMNLNLSFIFFAKICHYLIYIYVCVCVCVCVFFGLLYPLSFWPKLDFFFKIRLR